MKSAYKRGKALNNFEWLCATKIILKNDQTSEQRWKSRWICF